MKTQVVVRKSDGLIICLSFAAGRVHDFRLFKESFVRFLERIRLLLDSGYQGMGKIHGNCELPEKKTGKRALSKEDKRKNRGLSSARVRNEHVIGLVKRFRILAERYRNRRRRFGLLNHFDMGGKFLPYWYDTGTPSFLVKLIIGQKINIVELGNLRVGYDDFRKYDIENMKAAALLYQSGYLTVVDYDEKRERFTLDYPNDEVRSCFAKSLLEHYAPEPESASGSLSTRPATPSSFPPKNV